MGEGVDEEPQEFLHEFLGDVSVLYNIDNILSYNVPFNWGGSDPPNG